MIPLRFPAPLVWPTVFVVCLAVMAGGFIPAQGAANRGLGQVIGSYPHAALASLAGSISILLALWLVRRKIQPGQVRLRQLLQQASRRRYWYYWLSGAPGALYITVFAVSLTVIGPAAAVISTILGQMAYSLLSDWRRLAGKRFWACIGVTAIVGATLCVALGNADSTIYRSFDWIFALFAGATCAGGAGIVWQFATLGAMKNASSTLASAIVSSMTGFITAALLVVAIALTPYGSLDPPGSWPAFGWLYAGSLAGVGIIPISAFATSKLGKRRYTIIMTAGSILAGFLIGTVTVPMTATMATWQILGCIVAFTGVYLCLRESNDRTPVSCPKFIISK